MSNFLIKTKMKKTKVTKILLAVLVVLGLGATVVFATNPSLFQGKMSNSNVTRCGWIFGNYASDPSSVAKYGDQVDFKWNGPGCSKYEFSQYLLCFENVNNKQETACVTAPDPKSNHLTLTKWDWAFINKEMKTLTSPNRVDMNWYVQSRHGNALAGAILKTQPWKFSYTK
jgi:hypothetical protein